MRYSPECVEEFSEYASHTPRGLLVTPKQRQIYAIWHMVLARHDCYDGSDTYPRKGRTVNTLMKAAHSRSVGLHLPQAVLWHATKITHLRYVPAPQEEYGATVT